MSGMEELTLATCGLIIQYILSFQQMKEMLKNEPFRMYSFVHSTFLEHLLGATSFARCKKHQVE